MKKITPWLWFDGKAEEAARFYVSVFEDSGIDLVTHYGDFGPYPAGTVMTVSFHLRGEPFVALNAGPEYRFNPSVSFLVYCETQEELDDKWEKLTSGGGREVVCGWLTDRYGLSWQVVPSILWELMGTDDAARTERVMKAVMTMKKLDIAELKKAAGGE